MHPPASCRRVYYAVEVTSRQGHRTTCAPPSAASSSTPPMDRCVVAAAAATPSAKSIQQDRDGDPPTSLAATPARRDGLSASRRNRRVVRLFRRWSMSIWRSRPALRNASVNLDGSVRTIASPTARENSRHPLQSSDGWSGATTWIPRPPVVFTHALRLNVPSRAAGSSARSHRKSLGEIAFRDAEIRVDDPVRMREPDPGDNGSSGSRGYHNGSNATRSPTTLT